MTFFSFFDWLRKGDYTRSLEAEVARLREENQRLLNAMLKRAGYAVDEPRREPPAASAVMTNKNTPMPPLLPNLASVMRMPIQAEMPPAVIAQQKPRHGRGVAGINQSMREREAQAAREARERAEKLQPQIESYEKMAVEKAKGVAG